MILLNANQRNNVRYYNQVIFDRVILILTVFAVAFASFLLLSGCANTEIDREIQHDYYEAVTAQAHARSVRTVSRPTIEIHCGQHLNACKGLDFSYTDPDQDDSAVIINRARTTAEVNSDAFVRVLPSVVNGTLIGIGIYKGADLLSDALDSANNVISNVTNTNTADGGSKVITGSNSETNDNQRDIIDTNNSIADAHNSASDSNDDNSQVTDSNDNNAVDNSQQNQTSEPTIVEQPPPVIVDPVIVGPSYPPGE